MTLYLAYGSNLNVEQMNLRCPGAVPVGLVDLPDHQLVFRGSHSGRYLSVDPCPGSSVTCVAWMLGKGHEAALDRYEGYPLFYDKVRASLPVRSLDGQASFGKLRCMWYALPTDAPMGAPGQYYMRVCMEGYKHFGISEEALTQALRRSVAAAPTELAISLGFPGKESEA